MTGHGAAPGARCLCVHRRGGSMGRIVGPA
jgi:hypothetical protein